ncbi:SAV_915 family protein [Nocardioides montaniterrae]
MTSATTTSASRASARSQFPPVVYVPTTDEPDPAVRRVILHKVADGRTALFVYSAIDRLHDFYLPGQSWILCDVPALQRLHEQSPYDLLFLDVSPGLREGEA